MLLRDFVKVLETDIRMLSTSKSEIIKKRVKDQRIIYDRLLGMYNFKRDEQKRMSLLGKKCKKCDVVLTMTNTYPYQTNYLCKACRTKQAHMNYEKRKLNNIRNNLIF